ncbi:pyridoxal phosphate-dependent decarboxylase family protein [Flindersiella endophytica]
MIASLLGTAAEALAQGRAARSGPLVGGPELVRQLVGDVLGPTSLPAKGAGDEAALRELGRLAALGAADPTHPMCAAHLHCPPLPVAVAAEVLIAALNQSLDSWDQAPAATEIERQVIADLAALAGFDPALADGTITSGGTESNLMGLLLARDNRAGDHPLRILCSELAHFSIARSAALLGLGESAVVPIAVDAHGRLDVAALARSLADRPAGNAIVATAGTTDLGSIDPLADVAALARAYDSWLHVDAAYGGGALFSDRLAPLLTGLRLADSVSLDLHKLGWQPVPAGVFLARDRSAFDPLARSVPYLNPVDDEQAGFPSLLGRSLRTTRRADVLKLAVTFRALGREGLGELVDRCHELAEYAAGQIAARPALELHSKPVLTTVLFSHSFTVNAALRRRLLNQGRAVLGRADLDGRTWLKLTLLNPWASHADIDDLLDIVVAAGEEESP